MNEKEWGELFEGDKYKEYNLTSYKRKFKQALRAGSYEDMRVILSSFEPDPETGKVEFEARVGDDQKSAEEMRALKTRIEKSEPYVQNKSKEIFLTEIAGAVVVAYLERKVVEAKRFEKKDLITLKQLEAIEQAVEERKSIIQDETTKAFLKEIAGAVVIAYLERKVVEAEKYEEEEEITEDQLKVIRQAAENKKPIVIEEILLDEIKQAAFAKELEKIVAKAEKYEEEEEITEDQLKVIRQAAKKADLELDE